MRNTIASIQNIITITVTIMIVTIIHIINVIGVVVLKPQVFMIRGDSVRFMNVAFMKQIQFIVSLYPTLQRCNHIPWGEQRVQATIRLLVAEMTM